MIHKPKVGEEVFPCGCTDLEECSGTDYPGCWKNVEWNESKQAFIFVGYHHELTKTTAKNHH